MNRRLLHRLIIPCTIAIVALAWHTVMSSAEKRGLDTAMIEQCTGGKAR